VLRPIRFLGIIRAAPDLSQCEIRIYPIPSSSYEFNFKLSHFPISVAGYSRLGRLSSHHGPSSSLFHGSDLVSSVSKSWEAVPSPLPAHRAVLGAHQCCPVCCWRGRASTLSLILSCVTAIIIPAGIVNQAESFSGPLSTIRNYLYLLKIRSLQLRNKIDF